MATLRAATARHFQTDGISGDSYHHKYLLLPTKEGCRGRKSMLQAWIALKANCMFLHCWQVKHMGHAEHCMGPHRAWMPWNAPDQQMVNSNSSLHLATYEWRLVISLWLTIVQYGYHNSFASEALLPDWKNVNVHSNRTSCLTLIELNDKLNYCIDYWLSTINILQFINFITQTSNLFCWHKQLFWERLPKVLLKAYVYIVNGMKTIMGSSSFLLVNWLEVHSISVQRKEKRWIQVHVFLNFASSILIMKHCELLSINKLLQPIALIFPFQHCLDCSKELITTLWKWELIYL